MQWSTQFTWKSHKFQWLFATFCNSAQKYANYLSLHCRFVQRSAIFCSSYLYHSIVMHSMHVWKPEQLTESGQVLNFWIWTDLWVEKFNLIWLTIWVESDQVGFSWSGDHTTSTYRWSYKRSSNFHYLQNLTLYDDESFHHCNQTHVEEELASVQTWMNSYTESCCIYLIHLFVRVCEQVFWIQHMLQLWSWTTVQDEWVTL